MWRGVSIKFFNKLMAIGQQKGFSFEGKDGSRESCGSHLRRERFKLEMCGILTLGESA